MPVAWQVHKPKEIMDQIQTGEFKLIGLKLPHKTSNERGQSAIDCAQLWKRFSDENIRQRIPEKISDDIYAVYFAYEGDHTKPFAFFVGCKVKMDTRTPEGLDGLFVPAETCQRVLVKGKLPEAIASAWEEIWRSAIARAYKYDFEVYGEGSKDWKNGTVEIYLSLR